MHEVKLDRSEISMWFLKESKLRELLEFEQVSLVIKQGRLRWFRYIIIDVNVDHENSSLKMYGANCVKVIG